MVLQGILGFAEGNSPDVLVAQPRIHHQYLPDRVEFEPDALSETVQRDLRQMGHELHPLDRSFGNMQAVVWNRKTGKVSAASDPRGLGSALIREMPSFSSESLH
jgi:gamma-glutamyltranspeptidase/glutathione hydrolase